MGLEVKRVIGQRYNGAAITSEKFNSVLAHIRRDQPFTLWMDCASNHLNLAISYSCNVANIRWSLKQRALTGYPKRRNNQQESIQNIVLESKSSKLYKTILCYDVGGTTRSKVDNSWIIICYKLLMN